MLPAGIEGRFDAIALEVADATVLELDATVLELEATEVQHLVVQ